MNTLIRNALIVVAVGLCTPPATAQDSGFGDSMVGDFLVAPSVFYYSSFRKLTAKDEKSFLAYDLKAAYQVYPNVFAGLSYQGDQTYVKNSGYASESVNNTSKSSRVSYGPSIGYVTSSLHFMFTYFIDSQWKLNTTTNSGTTKYLYSGNGMQFDIGYKMPIWRIFCGPQLSYKSYVYSKSSVDGAAKSTISPKLEETNLEPSLVIHYFF